MSDSSAIVQRLWSYCSILRDDGLSYPDYVEQLTYLLFLKMAHETRNPDGGANLIPAGLDWPSLVGKSVYQLREHYGNILSELGEHGGMLGLIFRGARNKIRDPQKLRLLVVDLIDSRNWSALEIDVKGDAYEGLLEKNAHDTKSGAGQYFTPRPVVDAVVECVNPRPGETVYDPACGTGGFLISAYRHINDLAKGLGPTQRKHLRLEAIRGSELVAEVARLAAMNLFLHGIGPSDAAGESPIVTEDSLKYPLTRRYDVILTNPPFGKRSSTTLVTKASGRDEERRRVVREDLWVSTANKELNFLQHVAVALEADGRAAVVVPDGVLSGSGAGAAIRRRLMEDFELHTLLRLPAGIFYAAGVNANVLFFDKAKDARDGSQEKLWVYDLRTDRRFTLVGNRLARSDLAEFVELYRRDDRSLRQSSWSGDTPDGRWRCFDIAEILKRADCSLDLFWLKAASGQASHGHEDIGMVVDDIIADLQLALTEVAKLKSGPEDVV